MSERLVEKIGALLAKAESTDSEHERNALISKAQELATANAISLEMARQRKADKTKRERPVQKDIRLFAHGDKSKTKSLFVWLWVAIARENDLKVNIFHNSSGVIAFGFPTDIEIVETLYASLSIQMVTAAEAYLKSGEYKNEMVTTTRRVKDGWYGSRTEQVTKPLSGQTARRNFYTGFSTAIGERLREARLDAEAKVVEETAFDETLGADPFEPMGDSATPVEKVTGDIVLREKREEVADFYKAESRAKGSYRGGRTSGHSRGATNAGHTAGRNASLGGSRAGIGGAARALG